MRRSDFFYGSHLTARLIFGVGGLYFVVMTTSFWSGLLTAFLAAALIRILDGNWLTGLRVLRLLRWFVIPILLLHALFTPGEWLFPDFPLAISREGLIQGLWLSVHLISMYMMAVLLFRILRVHEWIQVLLVWPQLGSRLAFPILMMISMKNNNAALLAQLRMQLRLRSDWKHMPQLLLGACKRTLLDAGAHAGMLWLCWPNRLPLATGEWNAPIMYGLQRYIYSCLWAGIGCTGVLLSCL